jgi:hypothetical protein
MHSMDGEIAAHCFVNDRKERLLAEAREEPEALQLVLDRILHLGEAQLDACGGKGVVELGDDVGGGKSTERGSVMYANPRQRLR